MLIYDLNIFLVIKHMDLIWIYLFIQHFVQNAGCICCDIFFKPFAVHFVMDVNLFFHSMHKIIKIVVVKIIQRRLMKWQIFAI